MAIDLTMTFLLVTQPFAPDISHFAQGIVTDCIAILSGAGIAAIWYWWVLPSTPHVNQIHAANRLIRIASRLESSASPQEKRWMQRHGQSTLMQLFVGNGHDPQLITSGLRYLRHALCSTVQTPGNHAPGDPHADRGHCAVMTARLIQRHLIANRRIR